MSNGEQLQEERGQDQRSGSVESTDGESTKRHADRTTHDSEEVPRAMRVHVDLCSSDGRGLPVGHYFGSFPEK